MRPSNLQTFSLTSRRLERAQLLGAEAALLGIDGMVCSLCALNVLSALFHVKGVFITEVLWERGRATVAYNPTMVRSEQLLQAVTQAGDDRWHYHPYLLSTLPAGDVLIPQQAL